MSTYSPDEPLAPAVSSAPLTRTWFTNWDQEEASRQPRRRRDRHGRGVRGPVLPPTLPAWRTRAERFDEVVVEVAAELAARVPQVRDIQCAVEDVPPSDPAPWERGIVLGRAFDAEPRAGLPARIVIYRRPIVMRSPTREDMTDMVRRVMVEQIAVILCRLPEDLDPRYPF